jgi:predicted transcriptional regulator
MARILRVATSGDSKTHIMYKANLSHRQLDRYLDLLLEKGLLRVVAVERHSKAAKVFGTTDKGVLFLEAYRALKAIVRGKDS